MKNRTTALKLAFALAGLLFLSLGPARAQAVTSAQGTIICDPLFWRDQLKLTTSQVRKIREINMEYYQELLTASKGNASNGMTGFVKDKLAVRSEKIWSTFAPRQRKRWEKISAAEYGTPGVL